MRDTEEFKTAEAHVKTVCAGDCWNKPRKSCPYYEPLCKAYVFGDGPEVKYEEGLIAAYRKVVGNG